MLLAKLVSKITQYEDEENATKLATPESMGSNDVLTPYSEVVARSNDTAPVLPLFDNELVSIPFAGSGSLNDSRRLASETILHI